ncbi:chromate transporter [Bacillus taeanensis]|uniref:Chromate transporter n=1 Tax=Bacillus taeanensis TaxID=273032 RepID=A0A366Y1X1_9BACI|nr:chromate transporter [Bacillus taeanensis]RBW70979.1 chromate transporter [Bacillus taeanensis]
MKRYLELTIGFARTGVTGYGGGPATIPLIEYEAVKKYRWMTEEEFGETLALANTLPGPIATKMAAYIGYKVQGVVGAVVAILAHVLPSLIGMVGLLGFLYSFRNSPIVSGMVEGVTPVIGVMLAGLAYKFFEKGKKGLGIPIMGASVGLCFVFLELVKVHPGIVIALFLLTAFFTAMYKEKEKEKRLQVNTEIERKEKRL